MKTKLLSVLLVSTMISFTAQSQNNKKDKKDDWDVATFEGGKEISYKLTDNGGDVGKTTFIKAGLFMNTVQSNVAIGVMLAARHDLNEKLCIEGNYYIPAKTSSHSNFITTVDGRIVSNSNSSQAMFNFGGTYYFQDNIVSDPTTLTLHSEYTGANSAVAYVTKRDIDVNKKIGFNLGINYLSTDKDYITNSQKYSIDSSYYISKNGRYMLKTGLRLERRKKYRLELKNQKGYYLNRLYCFDFNVLTLLGAKNEYSLYDATNQTSTVVSNFNLEKEKSSLIGVELSMTKTKEIKNNLWKSVNVSIATYPGKFTNETYFDSFIFKLSYSLLFAL